MKRHNLATLDSFYFLNLLCFFLYARPLLEIQAKNWNLGLEVIHLVCPYTYVMGAGLGYRSLGWQKATFTI